MAFGKVKHVLNIQVANVCKTSLFIDGGEYGLVAPLNTVSVL